MVSMKIELPLLAGGHTDRLMRLFRSVGAERFGHPGGQIRGI